MTKDSSLISILSLIVAVLAVFVGPLISMLVTRKQIEASTHVTNKQILSPIRQNWINDLRSVLAEFTSKAKIHFECEDSCDNHYSQIIELEHRLYLMLNPKEKDHEELKIEIEALVQLISANTDLQVFKESHSRVMTLSQKILKREWERVKYQD